MRQWIRASVGAAAFVGAVAISSPVADAATFKCNPDLMRKAKVLTQADVPPGADLSNIDLRCGTYALDFVDVNLQGAKVDGANFAGSRFIRVNGDRMTATRVRAFLVLSGSFRSSNFVQASIYHQCNWSPDAVCPDRNLVLPGVNFDGANLQGALITAPWCANVSFRKADLTKAKFSPQWTYFGPGLECSGPNAIGRGDFTGATLKGSIFGTGLPGAVLVRADFTGANLWGKNLAGADLTGAVLRGANLQSANLQGANLTRAVFDGANLKDATFYGANVTGTRFKGAKGPYYGVGE